MTIVHERYEVGEPEEGSGVYDIIRKPSWMQQGACRSYPSEWWFPNQWDDHHNTERAVAICAKCPVLRECQEYGMTQHHGIWAGLSENERRRMRRAQWSGSAGGVTNRP